MNDSKFLNFDEPIDKHTGGNLPHWHQDGKIQFVTFRLADSLPLCQLETLKFEADTFRRNHPEPWIPSVSKEFWSKIGLMEERFLDNGHGSCVLRLAAVRDVLAQAIRYKDGIEYNVIAYVIMPNHVHLLLHLPGNAELSKVLHSIKRYSARKINIMLNRHGRLWMNESFDRIVRSYSHLNRCIEYIRKNPAYFPASDYTIYIHPKYQQ